MDFYKIKKKFNLIEAEFHLQNIFFHGIAIPNQTPFYEDVLNSPYDNRRYKRFIFLYHKSRFHTCQKPESNTPYTYKDGGLYFHGQPLYECVITHLPYENYGSERNWYFKYDQNEQNPYWELRLNPVNGCHNLCYYTGENKEFRGCAFCHRMYDKPRKNEVRHILKVDQMFDEIFAQYSPSVISLVKKILLVTGNTESAEKLLETAEEIYHNYLIPHGFQGVFSVATSQITCEEHIRRLAGIDNTIFEYPLECFTRREEILGPEKGIPMEQVLDMLKQARQYFTFTRVNYVVGLDPLEEIESWFAKLATEELIHDVVATCMTPFSPAMEGLRVPACDSVLFILEACKLLEALNLWTRRLGVEKSIFKSDRIDAMNTQDLFVCS